jgi:hypothetical protein
LVKSKLNRAETPLLQFVPRNRRSLLRFTDLFPTPSPRYNLMASDAQANEKE